MDRENFIAFFILFKVLTSRIYTGAISRLTVSGMSYELILYRRAVSGKNKIAESDRSTAPINAVPLTQSPISVCKQSKFLI